MFTNNRAAQNLAFVLSSSGVDPADLIRRSDYASEGEYYIALAKAAEALDNPKVRFALVKVKQQEREKELAEARKAEQERIRERAKSWILTEEQIDEIQSRAAAEAAKEFSSGNLDKRNSIASRQRELAAQYEREKRMELASHEAANQAIRAACLDHGDQEVADRMFYRPDVDT